MSTRVPRRAAVTGASGYLGALFAKHLAGAGYDVRLLRRSVGLDKNDRRFVLGAPVAPELLEGVDLLVHAAYDLSLYKEEDIWRVNVTGTRHLLEAATAAEVRRVVVISSMSAYEGTTQIYGRAKLAIEAATFDVGGAVVRPGLVYGDEPGGMSGSLRRIAALPVVPVFGGTARQYLVHEDDLVATVLALAEAPSIPLVPLGVAGSTSVGFRDVLIGLAAADGHRPHFVPVPWQLVHGGLRLAEHLGVRVGFRSDSILGLVHPAPCLPGSAELAELGIAPRPFVVER